MKNLKYNRCQVKKTLECEIKRRMWNKKIAKKRF